MKRHVPLHPLLFAVYPVVFVYAQNVDGEVSPRDLIMPLLVAVTGTALVAGTFLLAFRDLHRAGFATSLVVILFFSFGHVKDAVNPLDIVFVELPLLIAWGLLLVGGILMLVEPRKGIPKATGVLNVVAAVLCAINVLPIVRFELGSTQGGLRVATASILRTEASAADRDIYYLIFDRYASDRTLRGLYGFDNAPFYRWLENTGFYVAYESLANYPKTTHSLASSLNMTYLDDLAAEVGRDSGDWDPLYDANAESRVAMSLKQIGYRYYHIGSWWPPTAVSPIADENIVFDSPVEFSDVLLDTTILPTLAQRLGLSERVSDELHEYRRVRFQFNALTRISKDPAPTFTFAHFTLPHPPYVFDADGTFLPPEEAAKRTWEEAYLAQLMFTNRSIQDVAQDLLSGPTAEDPIIVLQSDEGPHPIRLELDEDAFLWTEATDEELGEELRILNAYYLPGLDDQGLYPTISPVNSFRLILSECLGAELPLLPDKTFVFESKTHPYRFTDVTSRLQP
ncbi:MAG: hypothetical protein ACRDQ2_15145 [Gaiellales bacterium]